MRVETSVMSESETLELEVARRNKQQGSCYAMEAWSERDRTKPTRMSVEMREEFETDSNFVMIMTKGRLTRCGSRRGVS